MKLKRFMFTASGLAVGASLVGSILTSCSHTTVDEKNKIDLDDNGYLSNEKTRSSFKDALKDALSRSTNWTQFKAALAEEIVYRWYVDRAAENKDSTTKNPTFRVNLDEWTDKIKKDYDETVKNLKNKYTDKWEFYLQNEVLDPLGGTEEAYKHAKLVEKVKTEFLSKVFTTNYFGYKTGDAAGADRQRYPNIYSPASLNLSEDKLKDPSTWKNLGFYARTNSSFAPGDTETIDSSFLAKNPDGDYATIQDFVFNRWFKTEKPFFSAASLFKYSSPKYVAEGKLSGLYDGVSTGTKIPDNPNEAFPFFGGYPSSEPSKGTNAYIAWYEQLLKDGFDTEYEYKEGTETKRDYNGTISIKKKYTEDSQTLLLSFGSQMIGGSANALYIPYANAAASLYLQMITGSDQYKPLNSITQDYIQEKIDYVTKESEGEKTRRPDLRFKDNWVILSNFMFSHDTKSTEGVTLNSCIDLGSVYPSGISKTVENEYHCPLFKDDDTYKFLYGTAGGKDGIRYVSNTTQVTLGKQGATAEQQQPWIFELNEAGMHAQTIDGYKYVVKNKADGSAKTAAEKQEALKEVLKYRFMQKKCGYNAEIISGDVFGDSGKLKSYFSDNFTNIILEMAFSSEAKYNIFRPIDGYKENPTGEAFTNTLFLTKICSDEKLGSYANLLAYLDLTIQYDKKKKYLDAYETANTKTFAYRTKQMENARTVEHHLTVYENGLLAPIAYKAENSYSGTCSRTYNTSAITMLDQFTGTESEPTIIDRTALKDIVKGESNSIVKTAFYTGINDLTVNGDTGMSPQISTAKSKTSNRFWYKSFLIDKMMYSYMSNKDGMANFIKGSAMDVYMKKALGDNKELVTQDLTNAILTTYGENKIFTSDRNYANFGLKTDNTAQTFFERIGTGFNNDYDYKLVTSGDHCDEYLNKQTYYATLAYLIGKDKNFENFYKILNTKISEDEMALVGYINKTNKYVWDGKTIPGTSTQLNVNAATTSLTGEATRYDWIADVNNIFDNSQYSGKPSDEAAKFDDAWISCDQYWRVINKKVGPENAQVDRFLAGFTGLQTKSSNQIDSGSKLQAAVFDNFAKCSDGSRVLSNDDTNKEFRAEGHEDKYAENYGCWFQYAGIYEYNNKGEKVNYTFPSVTWKDTTITTDSFKISENVWYPALKLGKRIAEYRSLDDLRDLAKKLGASFYGDSTFRQIGDGTLKINELNELKVTMLNALLEKDTNGKLVNLKCFQRMTDAELHEEGSDAQEGANKEYGFTDDKGNTFRILMTQINKSDVTEKKFAPKWENNAWVANTESPIQIQEFWYILANMATESSVQQMAITDVVKEVYGDDKLVVYDAQLYNCFDSVWIKDWSKKTIGA